VTLTFVKGHAMLFPRLAAIGVASVFAAIGPSHAAECARATYEQAIAVGRAAVAADPTATTFTDYSGDKAAKLLAAINTRPPVSDYPAEHVLVTEVSSFDSESDSINKDDDSDAYDVSIALVHDGCVIALAQLEQEDWAALRTAAIGDPS
jgi:hypothetical protein